MLMINTMSALPTTAMEARVSAVDSSSENACANAMSSPYGGLRRHRTTTLKPMRITVFRRLMAEEFGSPRAEMLAADHVFSGLGGRTIDQALDEGVSAKEIWREVCVEFEVPKERR